MVSNCRCRPIMTIKRSSMMKYISKSMFEQWKRWSSILPSYYSSYYYYSYSSSSSVSQNHEQTNKKLQTHHSNQFYERKGKFSDLQKWCSFRWSVLFACVCLAAENYNYYISFKSFFGKASEQKWRKYTQLKKIMIVMEAKQGFFLFSISVSNINFFLFQKHFVTI